MHKAADVIVIGAGPAGMTAAIRAAERGKKVLILEKMDSPGKKLLLCGNKRCNVTNAEKDPHLFVSNYMQNPKFMLSMLHNYSNAAVMDFFETMGVKLKVEPEQKVFPKSNKAEDVLNALLKRLKELNVKIIYLSRVEGLKVGKLEGSKVGKIEGVVADGKEYLCNSVIVATGGKTKQRTGSSGDGYVLAESVGHKIIEPRKSLYPFEVLDKDICRRLEGITVDAGITFRNNSGVLFKEKGEVMFAGFGLTGPVMINASLVVSRSQMSGLTILLDLFHGKNADDELLNNIKQNPNRDILNILSDLMPKTLASEIMALSKVSPDKKANQLTKEERAAISSTVSAMPFKVTKYVLVNKSVATDGGVDLKEIDNKTLESKFCKGLYFAGELLDVVGKTGGFNLQVAWSTGWTAGNHA